VQGNAAELTTIPRPLGRPTATGRAEPRRSPACAIAGASLAPVWEDCAHVLAALLTGIVLSFIGSMPVAGPIAVLVLSKGLDRQPRAGLFIAIGAAVAESVYAGLAFVGLTAALARFPWLLPASRAVGSLILSGIGAYLVARRPRSAPGPAPEAPRTRGTGRLGHAFLGLSVTGLNPTLIITWTAAVGAAHAAGVLRVREADALPFAVGVATGIIAWFTTLLALLGRFHQRLPAAWIDRVIKVMGLALLVGGLTLGVRTFLAWHGGR